MRIAVINETSAADRNKDILAALEGRRHDVVNVGMTKNGATPELTYIHTSLMTALLLHTERVDYVVGGCGTGLGYMGAVMQYPGVFCGHILTALDAWLFTQINGGNCIALMLNQGYGWASDVNLKFIFDAIFSVEFGVGYPAHRQVSQRESRKRLIDISRITHRPLHEIVRDLDDFVVTPALTYPGFWELLDVNGVKDRALADVLNTRHG